MKRRIRPTAISPGWHALVLAVMLAGCGKSDQRDGAGTPVAKAGTPVAKQVAAVAPAAPAAPSADSPEAAVRAVLAGLQENRPAVLWDALPRRYQRDITALVHDSAARMDAVVWQRGFGTASRLVDVLRTKKDFAVRWIADLPAVRAAGPANAEELAAAYDQLPGLLALVVESELGDLERVKSLDVGRFVDRTGTEFMGRMSDWSRLSPGDPIQTQLKQWLGDVEIARVSRSGETATLRIAARNALGEPITRDWQFVRIDGKWFPTEWADDWDRTMAETRVRLERFTEGVAANKPAILDRLDRTDAVLQELQKTETASQFAALMTERVVAPMMAALRGSSPGPMGAAAATGEGRRIVVAVRGELDSAQREELQWKLSEVGDAIVGVPRQTENAVEFVVAPVHDLAEYARRLEFLRVLQVDLEKGRIVAEPLAGP